MRLCLLLIGLGACVGGSDAGKTLVYAFDGEPQGRLDRTLCATGVGLNIPLGISDSLAYTVAGDGRSAVLGTCTIEDGVVTDCFTISPEVVLTIAENGDLVGSNAIGVEITDSTCSGATLESEWTLTLTELGIDAADVVAFGDMPNHRAMLDWAGRGYVVANGHHSLLSADFTVVPGNDADGVGRTVLELLA